MPISSYLRTLLVTSVACCLIGCGNDDKVYRVTGTVRVSGKPVSGVVVHFVPSNGRPSMGTTDDNGSYKLSYDKKTEGALMGKHKVYFSFRPQSPKEEIEFQKGKAKLSTQTKLILDKYGSSDKSTLSYEVQENNQVIDIDL